VKISGKPFGVKYFRDFNAKIVRDRVVYHFFVTCHIKAISKAGITTFRILDDPAGQWAEIKK